MECNMFYDIKSTPISSRESFNNTILLLTLVKSEHYYIVGFSRPRNTIEIAFDFDSDLHDTVTESMTVDFDSDKDNIVIMCTLQNIDVSSDKSPVLPDVSGSFTVQDDCVVYEYRFKKDKIIPASINSINSHLMFAKAEIIKYLENHYMTKLS